MNRERQLKLAPLYPHSRALQPPTEDAKPVCGLCVVLTWNQKNWYAQPKMIYTQIGWQRSTQSW